MRSTPYSSPPGFAVRKWYGWIAAEDESYWAAIQKLEYEAQKRFPDANWIGSANRIYVLCIGYRRSC
jgi:hypothetical protein